MNINYVGQENIFGDARGLHPIQVYSKIHIVRRGGFEDVFSVREYNQETITHSPVACASY